MIKPIELESADGNATSAGPRRHRGEHIRRRPEGIAIVYIKTPYIRVF